MEPEPLPDIQYVMDIARRPPVLMTSGSGSWLHDSSGRRYLDFIQGWAVNCLGHCPQVVVQAIQEQAGRLINSSPSFLNDRAAYLARLIAEHSFGDRTFFANSGAEANEGAIKLARKWGQEHRDGAFEIITTQGGFHGRTLATMSASGKPQWAELFEPKVPGFVKVPFNDVKAARDAIGPKTVAIMLEPIQGEAGVITPDESYLRELRALTSAQGLLLIADEIQTGVGRTGKLFGYEWSGVEPDIMTLGKGLGGGVPIAALVAKESVCCFEPGDQGGTFNGNPLVAAAAIAVLETLTAPGFLAGVRTRGDYLATRFQEVAHKHGHGAVRGAGMLRAVELRNEVRGSEVVKRAREAGLLINAPRENSLRLMPALNVTEAEIDQCAALLDTTLATFDG